MNGRCTVLNEEGKLLPAWQSVTSAAAGKHVARRSIRGKVLTEKSKERFTQQEKYGPTCAVHQKPKTDSCHRIMLITLKARFTKGHSSHHWADKTRPQPCHRSRGTEPQNKHRQPCHVVFANTKTCVGKMEEEPE